VTLGNGKDCFEPVVTTRTRPHGETTLPAAQADEVQSALLTIAPLNAPTIIYQLPHLMSEWQDYTAGARIGYTMVECDGVRAEVAEQMRGVDLLCTPSTYCADVFRRNVPGQAVAVLPNAIDTRIYPAEAAPPICLMRKRPSFLFAAVTTTHERKHWRELLHAFAEEFKGEDVGLFLKTNKPGDIDDVAYSCRDFGAWAQVDSSPWTDDMIAGLYGVTDCYALPSSEGFGLPFCESALYGIPSVALDVGGQTDIVNERTGYPVPTTMAPCVGLIPRYFDSRFHWASCSVADLRAVLRRAYESEKNKAGRGQAARRHVINHFTPERLGVTLREVVNAAEDLHKRNGHRHERHNYGSSGSANGSGN